MTIGEKIKELRHKNDVTQEKLAAYLSISSQSVSKWETTDYNSKARANQKSLCSYGKRNCRK